MMRKLHECSQCGKMVYIRSKGLCTYCSKINAPKKVYSISKFTTSKAVKERRNTLTVFFDKMLDTLSNVSVESGTIIHNFTRCNICHILPKRDYHSVETDSDNVVVLTLSEHARFDHLLDTRNSECLLKEFPNTMKIVKQRLEVMRDKVEEKGKLLKYLEELL